MNRILVLGLVVWVGASSSALAAKRTKEVTPPAPPVPVIVPAPIPPIVDAVPAPPEKTPQERVDAVDTALDTIDITVQRPTIPDDELAEARDRIPPLQDELDDIIAFLEPEVAGVNARLTELGAAPVDAATENADVAQERGEETKKKQILEDSLKRAHLLELKSKELVVQIAKVRREEFSTQLYARTPTIFGPTHWKTLFTNIPSDWHRFADRFSDGTRTLRGGLMGSATVRVVLALVFFVLLIFPGVTLADALGRRLAKKYFPVSRLRRTLVAVWIFLTTLILPLIGVVLVVDALESTGTVTIFMKTLLDSAIVATRISGLMFGLARAFLAPRKEAVDTKEGWRIVSWNDEQVATLRWLPLGIGLVSGLRLMIERANDTLGTSLAVSVFERTVLAAVSAVMVAQMLLRIGRARLEIRNAHQNAKDVKPSTVPRRGAVPVVFLIGLAWLALVAAAIAVLLGFNAFGIFLVRQLIQIAVVTTVLQLATMLTDDLFDALLGEHFPVGRFLRRAVGFSAQHMSQAAVVLAGVARVILIYVAVRIVLLRMGGEDVSSVAGRIQDGIADLRIGEVTISPSSIIGAVTVFAVVWLSTKAVRSWLEGSYLPHTTLDSGARNSINTGIGYIGFIAAVLLAIAYLGVSFDKVALIASALSVGIGFGLQQIISNFVSGLILLVERPIKVGDLVNVSGSTGDVKKISVRATEILLGDGSTFVVPNADLISKPMVNKTRVGVLGQVQFILRISYSVDPNEARALVLDVMKANDKVLNDPPPAVFIDDVDDRGYVFNIVGNTQSPRDTYGAKSDLFFEITRRLREAAIPIGSPIASVKIAETREADDADEADEGAEDEAPPASKEAKTDEGDASDVIGSAPEGTDSADDRPAMGDGKGTGGGSPAA